jgi:uncharacterized membrane protein YraQ (UPF0718 family)
VTPFVDYLREVADLTCETAPFLLVGFLLAGLVVAWVPAAAIYRRLGGDDLRSVVRAALYGVPLPLCSCSVIPAATSLKRAGASKGSTASFLISTPEVGVDSIAVTWALLDPLMTVARPVVAFATAVLTGSGVSLLVRRGWDSAATGELGAVADPHCHAGHGEAGEAGHAGDRAGDGGDADHAGDPGQTHPASRAGDPCHAGGEGAATCGAEGGGARAGGTVARLRTAVRYAFGPLLDDLAPWLLLGFLISALIAVLVPDDLFTSTVPAGLPAMLLMIAVATPLYICATASTPVAAALIAKGLDPGAALVFLLVGPATNATTLVVVARLLGAKALAVYLAGITGVAIAAGLLVNEVYALFRLDLAAVVAERAAEEPGWLSAVAGVVVALLLVRSTVRRLVPRRKLAVAA